MTRVSAAEVAALAGVSGQTVSRVVNGSARVDPGTRARVEEAMVQLGYRPNRTARALRSGRTGTIGVLVRALAEIGNTRMLEAVVAAAAQHGHAVLVATLPGGGDGDVDAAFAGLEDQGVDGAIVLNEATPSAHRLAVPPRFPVVAVDSAATSRFHVVQSDHAAGARAATRHLLTQGHRLVHHLAGPEASYAAGERERGWREALTESPPAPVRGDWSAQTGYLAGRMLLDDERVSAVFAANDQLALGLLHAAHERARTVAVVGFDDALEAEHFWPPLSTVAQDFDTLGARAVAVLLDHVAGRPATEHQVVPPRLIVRRSSLPAS